MQAHTILKPDPLVPLEVVHHAAAVQPMVPPLKQSGKRARGVNNVENKALSCIVCLHLPNSFSAAPGSPGTVLGRLESWFVRGEFEPYTFGISAPRAPLGSGWSKLRGNGAKRRRRERKWADGGRQTKNGAVQIDHKGQLERKAEAQLATRSWGFKRIW
jgi:hypothetical protein